jgi:hypothetical protein
MSYAHGWDTNVFVYFFNELKTWEGSWKSHTNHILNVASLFQNYNDHLSQAQQETVVEVRRDLIDFTNGRAAWAVFNFAVKECNVKVYGAKNPESVKSRIEVVPEQVRRQNEGKHCSTCLIRSR